LFENKYLQYTVLPTSLTLARPLSAICTKPILEAGVPQVSEVNKKVVQVLYSSNANN